MRPHVQFLQKYLDEGVFLVAGRQIPRTGGVIIMNLTDPERAAQIMAEDPFVSEGVATFEVVTFNASMTLPGLEGVFK